MTVAPEDDGRQWWFLGSKLWMGVHPYAAANARAALAAYRRDLTDAELANGRSRRYTAEYLRAAELYVVEGPLTTSQAYERELGWSLAWELCERHADISCPASPATAEECIARGMAADKVERTRAAVLTVFAGSDVTGKT